MKEKRTDPAVHDLRDRPVPPVKGAVTDRQDVCPRPEHRNAADTARIHDAVDFDNWM